MLSSFSSNIGSRRGACYHLLLAVVIATGWIGVLEMGVRTLGHRFPGSLYGLDRERFYKLRPNAEAWMTVERDAYVRTNNVGYHDRDRNVDPVPGSQRIAVLGSSDVAALYASVEHGLTASIERELAGPEVLNFGAEGYGLAQTFLTLQTEVWRFHPTVVALVIAPRTTIWKSVPDLNPDPMPYPYLDYDEKDQLTIVPHPSSTDWDIRFTSLSRTVISKFQLLCMTNQAVDRAVGIVDQIKLKRRLSSRSEQLLTPRQTVNWNADYAREPQSALGKKAWSISESTIHMFSEACKKHHVQLWLIVLDSGIEVSPNLKERDCFLKAQRLPDFGYLERRLQRLAERENIHYIAVGPGLASYTARTGHTLHGFGRIPAIDAHLNEEGNMVAGRMIGTAMRALIQ